MNHIKRLPVLLVIALALGTFEVRAKGPVQDKADGSGLRASYGKCIDATAGVTPAMQSCMKVEYAYQDKRLNMATRDCAAKGGLNCKIEITYDNQCAVVVVGDGGYNASNATTANRAVELSMKTCRDAGRANCHVYYSACSLPVRIR